MLKNIFNLTNIRVETSILYPLFCSTISIAETETFEAETTKCFKIFHTLPLYYVHLKCPKKNNSK